MRLLVTGARGFVGGHLVPRLAADGHEIEARDAELDVTDGDAMAGALRRLAPDAVVHLAAQSAVPASWDDPAATYRTNYIGTRTVLASVAACAPRARVLLVGSAEQYGRGAPGAPPFTEESPQRPVSPYGWTKTAGDLLGGAYAARGLAVVRVRAFNHTGPGQAPAFAAPAFARQIAEMEAGRREPVLRVGNLDSVRDLLDVEDVVDAYARLLDPAAPADAYNVASGTPVRIGDLLETLIGLARVAPAVETDASLWRETDRSVGDASRLRRATGWAPRRALRETLARLLDSCRAQVSAA